MDTSKLPKGPWQPYKHNSTFILDAERNAVAHISDFPCELPLRQLIIDAGNVAHETGKSPSELAYERLRAIATLRGLVEDVRHALGFGFVTPVMRESLKLASGILDDLDPPKGPALKPCKYCGGNLRIDKTEDGPGVYVSCTCCSLIVRESTREAAIAFVNK